MEVGFFWKSWISDPTGNSTDPSKSNNHSNFLLTILILLLIMGNSSTHLKGLDSRYQELGLEEHDVLSSLIVAKDTETHEKFFIKQMNITSDVEYGRILKEMRQRKLLSDKKMGKYLVRLKEVQGQEHSEICGKSFKLFLYI